MSARFRRVFLNPTRHRRTLLAPSLGRASCPAALMQGHDVGEAARRAHADAAWRAARSSARRQIRASAWARSSAAAARAGRDKLTFVAAEKIAGVRRLGRAARSRSRRASSGVGIVA